MEQIERIKSKIEQLKKLDSQLSIFGASTHQYNLGEKVNPQTISKFEKEHHITLPKGYRNFLEEIGNGGAGPFYGLKTFENSFDNEVDENDEIIDLSKPFPHTVKWNMNFKTQLDEEKDSEKFHAELTEFDKIYFSSKYMNGTLSICDFGCGVNLNLIVNGEEYGNMWSDDRVSDGGIYPSEELGNDERIKFLDWYELWLDNSINEINSELKKSKNNKPNTWWKFWSF